MSSIGRISLDLSMNSDKFNRQVKGIKSQTTKAFGSMSVAVGNIVSTLVQKVAASIGSFVKDSIEKGSELSELQNVVDSVFTTMADKVETFSKSALSSYGLTEAQSKKMMGTFGAMSKSFGYSEEQAFNMSAALTGLTADVASFYNLNHDEAYTKMKSVFTGETESLKELGVVMTQTALDEFALSHGFNKTTNNMSEQEKVALRLAFVQDKLSTASGDFIRTQDQWANQTRILTGQFESLKAALGQGFINILTPVIQMLNKLMAKLVQVANTFKSFTESLMGKKTKSGAGEAMKEVASAASDAASSTSSIEDATEGAAAAAKKAQKSLMNFDEINKLQPSDTSGGGSPSTKGFSFDNIDFSSAVEKQEQTTNSSLDKIKDKIKEIADMLKSGFKGGLGGDFENSISRIKDHIKGIGVSLKETFTDPAVVRSANKMFDKIAYAAGQIVGSMVSIGTSIAEMFIGGIGKYLDQNKDFIKKRLVGIFDAIGEVREIAGNLAQAIGSIFEVFRGNTAKQITADLIGIVENARLGIDELASKIGRDIINCIAQPIIDNKDKIKELLENMLKPVSTVLSTLNTAVKDTFNKIIQVYDSQLKPAFQSIANGLSKIFSTILDAFNNYVAPVLQFLANEFSAVWEEHVQPAINSAIEFIGRLGEVVGYLFENYIAPLVNFIIETIMPVIAPIIQGIGEVVLTVFGAIFDVIGSLFDVLNGIIDFIVGIFTGDWTRAWNGIKSVVTGVIDAIKSVISTGLNLIKNIFSTVLGAIKGVVEGVFNGILTFIRRIINGILGGIEAMVNGVIKGLNFMINALNKLSFKVPKWVPGIGGNKFGFNIPNIKEVSLPRLAEGGYVRANQPQPVIIGDNKTQGEIVAPEGKLLEVVIEALERFFSKLKDAGYSTSGNDDVGDIVIPIYLDGTMFDEVIVTAQQRRNLRSGGH